MFGNQAIHQKLCQQKNRNGVDKNQKNVKGEKMEKEPVQRKDTMMDFATVWPHQIKSPLKHGITEMVRLFGVFWKGLIWHNLKQLFLVQSLCGVRKNATNPTITVIKKNVAGVYLDSTLSCHRITLVRKNLLTGGQTALSMEKHRLYRSHYATITAASF